METDSMEAVGAAARPRECHKCPRNGKGDEYCWRVCMGPAERSDKGISYVRMGSLDAEGEFLAGRMDAEWAANAGSRVTTEEDFLAAAERGECDPDVVPEEDLLCAGDGGGSDGVTAELSDDVERALARILATLFGDGTMSDVRICILRHLYRGEDLGTIGRTLPHPMSKQGVFKHVRAMVAANPTLARVIMALKREGHGGARRRRAVQPDLFAGLG